MASSMGYCHPVVAGRSGRSLRLELVSWTVDTHDWRGDTAEEMFTL